MSSLRPFNRTLLIIVLLLLSFAPTTLGQGALQWRPLAPINGGAVLALLNAGGRVYAGTRLRGVFVSTDNGTTWRQASNGLGDIAVNALVAAGNNILAGTADGIYRTTDGGQSWTRVAASGQVVRTLLTSGANLFAGTATGSILRSTNEGQMWSGRGGIAGQPAINTLASFGGQLYAGTARGVFYSANDGQSWTASTSGLPSGGVLNVLALAVGEEQLFAGTSAVFDLGETAPQIYSSRDGLGWGVSGETIRVQLAPMLTGAANVTAFLFDESGMYAATNYGVVLFNGQQWTEFISNRGLPASSVVAAALIRSGGRRLLGGNGGVYTLASDGQQWMASNTGLTAAEISALAVRGNTIFASAGLSGLFRSQDDGQSWMAVSAIADGSARPFAATALAVKGNSIFAGSFISGAAFRSDNDGLNWTEIGGFVLPGLLVDLTASEQDVYVNSGGALYKLNPEGNRWVLPPGVQPPGRIGVAALAASGANVYATTRTDLLRSTNGGSNFAPLNIGAELSATTAVAARGNNVYLAAVSGNIPKIFVSTDNGDSFTPAQTTFAANRFALDGNRLYASAGAGGVYFSADNGINWTLANAGLADRVISAIAVKGETALAGTLGYGVYTTARTAPTALASVSAASFRPNAELAPESIAVAFGTGLATTTQLATTQPLPTTLAGTRVGVRDSAGVERQALLFFVSPTQVNYQIPSGTAPGNATVTVTSGDGSLALGNVTIASVAPGLFSANASGQGLAAAVALRIKADGTQTFEPVVEFNPATGQLVARPIDLGAETDQVFLILYGTGLRLRSSLMAVTVQISGLNAEVTFAGAQSDFTGLDQVNVRLPRSLVGRGEVEIALLVDGKAANPVRIAVR